VAVRIRLKKFGRKARPFFRVCVMDQRSPRDGRAIEELGTYDPMVPETDARAILNGPRINYWLGVGAQPSPKVATLIKKYGEQGTHVEAQKEALDRLSARRNRAISRALEAIKEAPRGKSPAELAEEAAKAAEAAAAAEAAEAAAAEAAAAETAATEAAGDGEAAAAADAEAAPADAAPADATPEGEAKPE
jgi:small subunit ribosomal protein S16